MEMDVLSTDEMLMGDLGMFPMGDSDMHNLLNDIKSTEVESSDMDRYLTDSKSESRFKDRFSVYVLLIETHSLFHYSSLLKSILEKT